MAKTNPSESLIASSMKKVFDDKNDEVLVNLDKAIKDTIDQRFDENTEEYIDNALKRRGIDTEVFGLTPAERSYLKIQKAVQKARQIWDNEGYIPGVKDKITLQDLAKRDEKRRADWTANGKMVDAVFPTDQPMIIPRVIEQMVRESVEPIIALTPLMQTINVSGAGTVISFPAIGDAMVAHDVGPNGEYHESSLEFGGQVTANIGKSGIAVKVSDDLVRYSMFDLIGMHIRAAGKALVRHKEKKVASLIFNNGVTVFDNTAGGLDTSGRGSDGNGNATMTIDDFLIMYADMANDGFIPDTAIIHPFAWFAWARDPVMRALFMQGNNAGFYYQSFQGSIASASAWKANNMINSTTFGTSGTSTGGDNGAQNATTFTMPGILPTPLKVIVTPFQEVSYTARTSTITLADSSRLGMLLVDSGVETDEFKDVMHDLMKIRFRERYGLALHDNGQAIRHAKNVNWWNKSYAVDDLVTWQAGTGLLPSLDTGSVTII